MHKKPAEDAQCDVLRAHFAMHFSLAIKRVAGSDQLAKLPHDHRHIKSPLAHYPVACELPYRTAAWYGLTKVAETKARKELYRRRSGAGQATNQQQSRGNIATAAQ
jgi:hypothetical protein